MNNILSKDQKLNSTLVIDGASGILGYELANFFSDQVDNVILIGRSLKEKYKRKEILKKNNVEYYSDYSLIPKIRNKQAVFIHTASSTPNNNSLGDKNIFDENTKLRNKVFDHLINSEYKLIINISSMSVYGQIKNEILFEDHPTLPTNLYGLSKLLSEYQFSIFSNYSSISNIVHLRLPGIISKEAKGIFIASLIEKIKNNYPIKVFSKDSLFNNATTSIDIARTIKTLMKNHDNLPKEIFLNMCSKDTLSINEIIIFISNKLQKDCPELIFDKNISTFLIKNNQHYNLISNSLLLDMLKIILKGN